MKIESFTIKNYRSIKTLKMHNLNPVNVFFGKNNVGKSNILRGLHLVFYCLKNDKIYLPDTMFFNRNIYRPIDITVHLILDKDFCDTEEVSNTLKKNIEAIRSVLGDEEEMLEGSIEKLVEVIDASKSFKPVVNFRLKVRLDYSEETSDVKASIEDLTSDYRFDYAKYKASYEDVMSTIEKKIREEREKRTEHVVRELSFLGADIADMGRYLDRMRYGLPADVRARSMEMSRLRRSIANIKDSKKRNRAYYMLEEYGHALEGPRLKTTRLLSEIFNVVKEYFDRISDNFILIPNKEYFRKRPLTEKNGDQIEIFDMNRFVDRLVSLIESPTKKERELIHRFLSVFNKSYSDLGQLETITKVRDEVFAIFGTSLISLPVEQQGLGVQDLFLYLTQMILYNSAIVAIEEPEGGLSTENQRILHNIIEDVYSGSGKQIFISSHSEEFETPNSYIIEMGKEGTKEISRMQKKKEYEEKIDGILIKRKLAEEKEQYEALLKEVTERQMALDILNYIDKLDDKEKVDPKKISGELGYKKEKVEEILREITRTTS